MGALPLSYWQPFARVDSNHRHAAYQADALTRLSYGRNVLRARWVALPLPKHAGCHSPLRAARLTIQNPGEIGESSEADL